MILLVINVQYLYEWVRQKLTQLLFKQLANGRSGNLKIPDFDLRTNCAAAHLLLELSEEIRKELEKLWSDHSLYATSEEVCYPERKQYIAVRARPRIGTSETIENRFEKVVGNEERFAKCLAIAVKLLSHKDDKLPAIFIALDTDFLDLNFVTLPEKFFPLLEWYIMDHD